MTPEDLATFERAGLYDPDAPWAADRREALELLLERGATVTEIVDAGADDLGRIAARLSLQPRGGRYTRRELAERAELPLDLVERIWRAAALPEPDPDAKVAGPDDIAMLQAFAAATDLFSTDVVLQTTRVLGASVSRLADAMVSAFVVDLGPTAATDPSCLSMVRANFEATSLVAPLMNAFDRLLRHHMVLASRPVNSYGATGGRTDATADYPGLEVQWLAVGFLDLVDSTGLARELPFPELSAVMSAFERDTSDTVVRHGGRVVKLIGDEIMFTASDPAIACAAALDVSRSLDGHPVLRGVHGGIAAGPVLLREGDCFGPVVNLAARLAKRSEANEVLVDPEVAAALDAADGALRAEPLGEYSVAGIDTPVTVSRLVVEGRAPRTSPAPV